MALLGGGLVSGARPLARRLALALAIGGLAIAVVQFAVDAVRAVGDSDRYGRVSLPGEASLELPEGDIALYYEEHVSLSEHEHLDEPEGLVVEARREATVRSEKLRFENSIKLQSRSLVEFAKLVIPEAGRYRITASSGEPGAHSPAVTLGESQSAWLGRDLLRGGLILGGALALGFITLLLGHVGATRAASPSPRVAPTEPLPSSARDPTSESGGTSPAAKLEGDPAVELRELERLRDSGALSAEEYAARRERILDSL